MNRDAILALLSRELPGLLAIYAFGSRVTGTANQDSDLDLAVLVPAYADAMKLWTLASELSELARCPVDLLDLRAASTVMQYQIITQGERWWSRDSQALLYEAVILSEKTTLDEARAGLLNDIAKDGKIYGR